MEQCLSLEAREEISRV